MSTEIKQWQQSHTSNSIDYLLDNMQFILRWSTPKIQILLIILNMKRNWESRTIWLLNSLAWRLIVECYYLWSHSHAIEWEEDWARDLLTTQDNHDISFERKEGDCSGSWVKGETREQRCGDILGQQRHFVLQISKKKKKKKILRAVLNHTRWSFFQGGVHSWKPRNEDLILTLHLFNHTSQWEMEVNESVGKVDKKLPSALSPLVTTPPSSQINLIRWREKKSVTSRLPI